MPSNPERDRVLRKLPGWDQERVRGARILVVGAGALGNEVLKNLALLNVGKVMIVDFDHIESSNLSRSVLYREVDCQAKSPKAATAAYRIKELNPEMQVQFLNGDVITDLGLGLLRRMDVVIGCLDNRLARLYLNRHCHWLDKTWVNGGILNLAGQVNVYAPGKGCYECELTNQDWKNIRTRLGCTDIARRNSVLGQTPTSPLSASVIGALQVQEAMKVLFAQWENSLAGKRFYFDGRYNVFKTFLSKKLKPECDSHFRLPRIEEAPELSATTSLGTALKLLAERGGHDHPVIELDQGLIMGLATMKSKKTHALVLPRTHFSDTIAERYREVPGEEIGFPQDQLLYRLDANFPFPEYSLARLGIPPLHILRVRMGRKVHYVELSGDESLMQAEGEIQLPDWETLDL